MSGTHKMYATERRGIYTEGERRGQYSRRPRGLFSAVTVMRRGLAQGTITHARYSRGLAACRCRRAVGRGGRTALADQTPERGWTAYVAQRAADVQTKSESAKTIR
jgi:hypothetical protein